MVLKYFVSVSGVSRVCRCQTCFVSFDTKPCDQVEMIYDFQSFKLWILPMSLVEALQRQGWHQAYRRPYRWPIQCAHPSKTITKTY